MNKPSIAPLLRPSQVIEPGIYRYKRPGGEWRFAEVFSHQGHVLFADAKDRSAWFHCIDSGDDEDCVFSGPIDPAPVAVTVSAEDAERILLRAVREIHESASDGTIRDSINLHKIVHLAADAIAAVEALPPLP